MNRCPDCITASNGDPNEPAIAFGGMVDATPEERLAFVKEMMPLLLQSERLLRPVITEEDDRRLWEGYASTRPNCACGGTGYIEGGEGKA
jgi:hypothetical protein